MVSKPQPQRRKSSDCAVSVKIDHSRDQRKRRLPIDLSPQRFRPRSNPTPKDTDGNSKFVEIHTASGSISLHSLGERHDSRRKIFRQATTQGAKVFQARGETRKEGSRNTTRTVRQNSLHVMEKWRSRLQKGDVVLEDPRFSKQRTESDSGNQSSSFQAPYFGNATILVDPKKANNKRTLPVETLSKRIKSELVEEREHADSEKHSPVNSEGSSTLPLASPCIKRESDVGQSSPNRRWILQKFIDGVISGDPINISELGFPVPIGRDPLRVKIHLGGPKKKHVSRYHAELHEHENGLRIQNFSHNGIVVNESRFVAEDSSFILKNSDTFSIGDASESHKDSVQNIMFTVRCEIVGGDPPDVKPELGSEIIEVMSDSEEVDQKTPMGSSTAFPILIVDDDDGPQAYEGPASVRVEDNQGFSEMLMKFKEEPVEDEETSAESPSTASSTGSPVILAVCDAGPARTVVEKPVRIEQAPKNKSPVTFASVATPRPGLDSPTESRAPLFSSPPPPRIRDSLDVVPCFNAYRQCILNLDFSKPDGDPSQISERVFIEFVQQKHSSKTLRDVTRVLFSFFCLEAASRVKACWKKNQQSHSRRAAIVAQAALNRAVLRVTIMMISEGRGHFSDCTAVKLSANFVRLDGQGTKKRVLLGMVHRCETVDRRRRSGGIQVPSILADDTRSTDNVDILEIDLNQGAFKGAKLNTDVLVDVSRVCEVRELKKILCLRQIPDSFCKFLRGIKPLNVVGPNDLTSPSCPKFTEQVARITHCSMLTSEQTSVVCATLSLLAAPAAAVSMMLVEGGAGTGKSSVLLETAFECVVAKPEESVLIFCKWSSAADMIAFTLLEIAQRKKFRLPNGEPISVCRVAGSQKSQVQRVCLPSLLEERRNSTLKQEIERKDKSIQEQKTRISDLKLSLEDQLEKLQHFVKMRKLDEISQQESALRNDIKEREILVERLKQPASRYNGTAGATTVLESSNILICSTADIETNIIGQAFKSCGPAKISVVLIDQAQQCLLSDLVPIMQLNCQRLVMFGDSCQSVFLKHVVKHKFLKENNPYVPSEFVKCCRKYSNKRFRLTRHFRVNPPLRDIVASIFIRNPSSPSIQTFNEDVLKRDLSPLTIFDITEEAREELILERIIQACAKVFTKIHLIGSQKFVTLNKKCMKDYKISMKLGIPEVLDADLVQVLIIPIFDSNVLNDINVDPASLYSMLTRATTATIVVGNFTNMKDRCAILHQLAEQSKGVGRFFHHGARMFMHMNVSEILMLLRP